MVQSPPYHGSSLYIKNLLQSKLKFRFDIVHLNTSDYRDDLNNFGKFDFQNIIFGIKNLFQLSFLCYRNEPALIYFCPSQNLAYLRDGLFILVGKLFSKAKIVQHLHGSDFYVFYSNSNLFIKLFVEITQRLVDHSIVLGNSLKQVFLKWHSDEKISVIPNGINLDVSINGKFQAKKTPVLYFLSNL